MSTIDTADLRRALTFGLDRAIADATQRLAAAAERDGLAEVAYASFDSPLGRGHVAATERGIVSVGLPNLDADDFLARVAAGVGPRVLELPGRLDPVRRQLDRYFAGSLRVFDLDLDWALAGSQFASRVLHETAKLGYGETASYGEVAARAGNPRAHRAAGTALGHNPLPIVVPCHRVLRAGGILGNYGGGPEMKEWLLRMEGAVE
jgi:methylated-DNA-[protein]-cysteine S-methyltransferase